MPSTPSQTLVTRLELIITSQGTTFTNFLIQCVRSEETDSRKTCLEVTAINNCEGCIRTILVFLCLWKKKDFLSLFEYTVTAAHHTDRSPVMYTQMSGWIRM